MGYFPVGGHQSDIVVAKKQLGCFISNTTDGECIIGDEGFFGLEEWNVYCINNKKVNELSRREYNRIRVLVEQAIEKLKKWEILSSKAREQISDDSLFEMMKEDRYKKTVVVSALENVKLDLNLTRPK